MFNYKLYPGRTKELIEFEKKEKPIISIITAYYNGDKYIDETINSVLNQTFPYWEWIIVNDGSTEEKSLEKLKEIEKIDKRIKVIHKENSGLAATRDYGAQNANENSKYLFFLDDDDLINKTYLECAYWTLQTNKDATWAYTDVVNFQAMEYKWIKYFDSEIEKKENLLVATALIRKKDFWEVNGYELREKAVNEDWNLWLKLLAKGKKPVRMNFDGFWYRRKTSGSELERSKQNQKRTLSIINETSKTVVEKINAIQYPKQDYNWEAIKEVPEDNVKYRINENGKINILMIIPWMVTGGADRFNLELIRRIDKNKFNIIIVSTLPNDNTWRQEFEEQAIIYDLTTFLNREYWPAFINNLIQQYRISIIFNTNSSAGYSMIPYLKSNYPKIPIIDYVHMEEWYFRNGGYSRYSAMYGELIDKTLVCNENSRKILIDYFGRKDKEVETVYIGVDEERFNPNKYNKEKAKEKFLGKIEDKKVISFICRISEQKRPMLFLKIISRLKEIRQDFKVLVVGDGNLLNKMIKKASELKIDDYIIFTGNLDETEEVYSASDLTVNCSLKEGLALTSYESLSMGVPVISSNVGGQKELINNEVGRIIEVLQDENDIHFEDYKKEEIENYVSAINEILDNLNSYKEKCRNRIIQNFTQNKMIEKMTYLIESISKNPNEEKIRNGQGLTQNINITKELIISNIKNDEDTYNWLCLEYERKMFGRVYSIKDIDYRKGFIKEKIRKIPICRFLIKLIHKIKK